MIPDYTFAAGYMYPGRTLRATLTGRASTPAATQGNITFTQRWGGVGGVSLVTTGALAQAAVQTNLTWILQLLLTCRSTGTSGTMISVGQFTQNGLLTANTNILIPATAPAVATVDTTIAKALSHTVTYSAATAGLTITCHQYLLEAMS